MLIVGGAGQGKREYAARRFDLHPEEILDGEALSPEEALGGGAVCALHGTVRQLLAAGGDPLDYIVSRLEARGGWIVTCDEVGCGVVPVDRAERRWREAVGRVCCALAERADVVERMVCGLPQRIKGQDR